MMPCHQALLVGLFSSIFWSGLFQVLDRLSLISWHGTSLVKEGSMESQKQPWCLQQSPTAVVSSTILRC